MVMLSAAEQAMEDAMLRSTPTPEPVLGKRTYNSTDGDDTEPDDELSPETQCESSLPLSSNVAAATVRYAAKKKLRPEQRDEVDAFLLVSSSLMYSSRAYNLLPGYSAWPTGQIICMHTVS